MEFHAAVDNCAIQVLAARNDSRLSDDAPHLLTALLVPHEFCHSRFSRELGSFIRRSTEMLKEDRDMDAMEMHS